MKKFFFHNLIISALLTFPTNVIAIKQQKIIDIFNSYLNSIRVGYVDFTQISIDGTESEGVFLLKKPYDFRCNYFPPYPYLIIGNKHFVSFYDFEMKELSRMKQQENIFRFILSSNLDGDQGLEVTDTNETPTNYVIQLNDYNHDKKITMYYSKKHKKISKIIVDDSDNGQIILMIHHAAKLKNLPKDLFVIKNPDIFGPPKHLDRHELFSYFD